MSWTGTDSSFIGSQQPQDLWHESCFAASHDLIPGNDIWAICNASKWVSGCGFTNVGLHLLELFITLAIVPLQALRFKLKRDIDKAEHQPMSSFTDYERGSVDERLYQASQHGYHQEYHQGSLQGYGKVHSHSFDSIRLQPA
ncbi:hypothetical protein NQZ79_g5868 [Umbelopsis isabellina]|nr:hypothetical protein NQZ79_g5868 [Umbelopsis isabellina]